MKNKVGAWEATKKTEEPVKSQLKELFLSTTVHAIPNITRNKSYVLKAIWFLLLVSCLSFCMYSTVLSILGYLNYRVLLKLDKEQRFTDLPFPMVSICNLDTVDFSNRTNLERQVTFSLI
jgi:hypothetical protein